MNSGPSFGQELRRIRRSHPDGISLADVADEVGCSITYISAIERGERNPPNGEMIKAMVYYMDAENEYEKLLNLSVMARKSVEIPVDGKSPTLTNALLGLARRSEQGLSDDHFLVKELDKLIVKIEKKEKEEEKCQDLFRELPQNRKNKLKKRPRNY